MITAPPPKQYPIPDEGRYTLKITKIADKVKMTQWGERTKIVFTLDVIGTDNGEGNPMRVFSEYYKSLGKVSKPSYLAKFVEKVIGRKLRPEEFQEFDENELLNMTVEGEIVHNETPDRVYANLDEVYKNRPNGRPAAPATFDAPPVSAPDDDVPF